MDTTISVTGLALFGGSLYAFRYLRLAARPVLKHGNDKIKRIMDACPSLQRVFWPPPQCWGAHTQLIPFVLQGMYYVSYPRYEWIREEVVLPDGELLALDWAFARNTADNSAAFTKSEDHTPILMLHHGAMCNSSDMPGQDYIGPALARGWLVCVLNRRGHVGVLRRPKWNFFGCVQDVRCATQAIKDRRPNAKLFTVGLSSGSAIVATIFGYGDDVNHFHAGVGICPGFCIEKCMGRFSSPYMELVLRNGKETFLKANEALLQHLPGYQECLAATNLHEWLGSSYAMAGYESREAYYRVHNPQNHVYKTKKPALFINSENDPLCVVQNYHEEVPKVLQHSCCVGSVLTKTGSHLPFYEGVGMTNWAEKVVFEFFDAVLADETKCDTWSSRRCCAQ